MSQDYIQDYIKAGKAVIAAKKKVRKLVQPGILLKIVADQGEEEIIKNGCELSFPINISLNEIAAHYSPKIDDLSTIPESGLIKIDIGAHYNGYIADSAFSINIDENPKFQNYIDAAHEALEAAIEIFNPGTKLYELGAVIEQKIKNKGLIPITNLGGHELKQYNLHAGPFIPNHKNETHNQMLKPGDAYACEPFATSGFIGEVGNGTQSYIYRFRKKVKKNIPYEQLNYMNKIEENFKRLPFSPRWIEKKNLIPKNKIKRIIKSFLRKRILEEYPILIEKSREPVSQEEHTIVLDLSGKKIVTTKE